MYKSLFYIKRFSLSVAALIFKLVEQNNIYNICSIYTVHYVYMGVFGGTEDK